MSDAPKLSSTWLHCGAGLLVAALLVVATVHWADLRPVVDRDFFFSSKSGTLAQSEKLETLFERSGQLVVIARSPDIGSGAYRSRIDRLEQDLLGVAEVLGAKSLASGPGDLEDARDSPLWRRLLLASDGSATHLLVFVRDPWSDALIPRVEAVVARHQAPGFSLTIGGIPYTVTTMQRQLARDFSVFSAVAVAGFGLASLLLFRSLRVALGVLASCIAAICLTFLTLQASGASLGLLSANLVTIVFVLTQSHLVFLTSNWRETPEAGEPSRLRRALRQTLRPSLASMVTTLLGFGTLLFVDAKPLRELGLGGVLGGVAAFAVAYGLYPLFLTGPGPAPSSQGEAGAVGRFLEQRRAALGGALAALCLLAGLGLVRLDTDPSLLRYFDEDGDIHAALAYLDRNSGSAPLEIAVRRADGGKILDGEESYRDLWRLQRRLEEQPGVGRIMSLPVLLAEGDRFPLSFLVPRKWMLALLDTALFDEVGESFVDEQRRHTLFALQMVEEHREDTRVEVVERLRGVVAEEGFEAELFGGVYYLQGKLSQLVSRSMVQSLAALALLFTAVAWLAAGSLRLGLAMTAVLALVPLGVFGAMGALGIPVDVVTAPAASIGLGIGADALLHLAVAARRASDGAGAVPPPAAWRAGIRSQWKGIARVSLIVGLGFALFAFSGFPPTRRFGLAVSAATLLTAPVALLLLPLAGAVLRRREA